MAVTLKIFILLLGVAIVKSHHLHHMDNHQHLQHRRHLFNDLFHLFGSALFGDGDSQPDELPNNYDDMEQEGNYEPSNTGMDYQNYGQYDDYNAGANIPDQINGDIGLPNGSHSPDVNFDISVANEPQSPDVHFNVEVPHGPQTPDVNLNTALPNGPQSPDVDSNISVPNGYRTPDVNFNTAASNGPQTPDVNFNTAVPTGPQSPDVHFKIAVPNGPQIPNIYINIAVPNEPSKFNVQGLNSSANEGTVINANVNVPANTNGQSDEPQREPNVLDSHVDINNQSQINRVPDEIEIPNINTDTGLKTAVGVVDSSGSSPQNNPGEKNGDVIAVPGFTDDDIKKGIIMVDPELKYNINESHEPKISDELQGQYSNVTAGLNSSVLVQGLNPQKNMEDKKDESNGNEAKGSGFNDDQIKKGVLMVDPELKYNTNENYEINVPDFNVVKESNVNEGVDDIIGNKKNIPGLTGDNISMETSTDEPKLSHNVNELQSSQIIEQTNDEQAVPGFNDDDIKKGTMAIDPELKNNETNVGLDRYSDAMVFPDDEDEAKKQNQVNTDDKQSLPNRFSAGDSNTEYPSAVTPDVALTTLSSNNYIPGQWTTNNNGQTISKLDNQDTQNQYTKPNGALFGQSPNQQIPVNNENGSPYYINVVRNPNGDYTVVNDQNPSHVYVSGNSEVNNPGQSYVFSNSAVNNPGQGYISGNSAVNNPGQGYISSTSPVNNPGQGYISGNSAVNNPVVSYVSGSSGLNNPGLAYIPVNVNSGVTSPGQNYVVTDGGNSQAIHPGQIYVSGINNQGQIYVPANSGANNPGQMYVFNNVPSSESQTTSGGYYNVVQLSNGQTVLVPVNGNGENTQWNGQSNNGQMYVPVNYNPGQGYQTLGNNPSGSVVALGNSGISGNVGSSRPTNNVPLLISYKDKDGENEEKSTKLDEDDKKEE